MAVATISDADFKIAVRKAYPLLTEQQFNEVAADDQKLVQRVATLYGIREGQARRALKNIREGRIDRDVPPIAAVVDLTRRTPKETVSF